MTDLFPFKPEPRTPTERLPSILEIEDERADDVFSALSSETGRQILSTLYTEPNTASGLADELDTTLQNVQYHLGNLEDAALIEVVDTWYSERGREMKVFAPSNSALVLFSGQSGNQLRDRLLDILGVGLLIGILTIGFRQLVRWWGDDTERPLAGYDALEWLILDPGMLFLIGALSGVLIVIIWSLMTTRQI